eukprot:1989487-Prymnesium_polylepis.1
MLPTIPASHRVRRSWRRVVRACGLQRNGVWWPRWLLMQEHAEALGGAWRGCGGSALATVWGCWRGLRLFATPNTAPLAVSDAALGQRAPAAALRHDSRSNNLLRS